jgi:hypothetical protein
MHTHIYRCAYILPCSYIYTNLHTSLPIRPAHVYILLRPYAPYTCCLIYSLIPIYVYKILHSHNYTRLYTSTPMYLYTFTYIYAYITIHIILRSFTYVYLQSSTAVYINVLTYFDTHIFVHIYILLLQYASCIGLHTFTPKYVYMVTYLYAYERSIHVYILLCIQTSTNLHFLRPYSYKSFHTYADICLYMLTYFHIHIRQFI